jgi:sporulation integral membrane protein YtvI
MQNIKKGGGFLGKMAWERWASVLICLCLGVGLLWLCLRYALPLVLPFALSWGISLAVRPMARRLSARLGISSKICSVVLLKVLLSGGVALLSLCVGRLLGELQHLLEKLVALGENNTAESFDLFELLTSKIEFLRRLEVGERFSGFRDRFNAVATEMLTGMMTSLSAKLPDAVATVAAALPSLLLTTVVTVVAGFYFCVEDPFYQNGGFAWLPASMRKRMPVWRARMKRVSWRYLRAYLLLLLLTFAQLFLGFSILRVEYAFLLSLVVSLVDLLPILGVGTVLVPWAIVALIQRDLRRGIGLLLLYLVITVLRQVLEPRLLGKSLGLSPLLTLFSTWVGWKLLGVFGMLIAPFLALIFKLVVGEALQMGDHGNVENCDQINRSGPP